MSLHTILSVSPCPYAHYRQDGDGRLSRREFRHVTQSAIGADGQPLSGIEQRRHFDRVDANLDGAITLAEFLSSSEEGAARAPAGHDPVTATMAHFDSDGDGQLDEEELQAMLSMSHGVDRTLLDIDGDGFVTKEELAAAMQPPQGSV